MDLWQLIGVGVVAFLAAVVQGGVGFGFGLVAVALMSVMLAVADAAVLNAVPALTVNLLLLWRLRASFDWRRLRALMAATVLATPLGVFLLDTASAGVLYVVLAAVLIASVVHGLWWGGHARRWHPLWLGAPLGGLAGVLTGVFGTGGPPVVAYVASQRYDKYQHVASVQAVLAVANVLRLVVLIGFGTLEARHAVPSAVGAVAAAGGAMVGVALLLRLPTRGVRVIVQIMLLAVAVHSAVRALAHLTGS